MYQEVLYDFEVLKVKVQNSQDNVGKEMSIKRLKESITMS